MGALGVEVLFLPYVWKGFLWLLCGEEPLKGKGRTRNTGEEAIAVSRCDGILAGIR